MKSHLRAIGLALAGYTLWVLADTNIKLVGASALPAYEVIALLGLAEVVLLLAYALWRKDLKILRPRNLRHQFFRSLLDLFNNICVVIALRHLPLALFYILIFLAPTVTTLLAAFLLHEALDWKRAAAIAGGFLGVVLAVLPSSFARPAEWPGYLACLVCVTCFSANMVWSRVMTQSETPESLTFSSGLLMSVTGFAAMFHHAEPVSTRIVLVLDLTALFCVVGSICFFVALKHTSAATVSQYHYSQLLTGALVSYLIWREIPTPWMLLGAALIVTSGLYTATAYPQPRHALNSPCRRAYTVEQREAAAKAVAQPGED